MTRTGHLSDGPPRLGPRRAPSPIGGPALQAEGDDAGHDHRRGARTASWRVVVSGVEAHPPTWLLVLSWVSLSVAGLAALDMLWDLYGRRHRQKMGVMEAVWPVTALYWGPVASVAYRRWGRPRSERWLQEQGLDEPPQAPA